MNRTTKRTPAQRIAIAICAAVGGLVFGFGAATLIGAAPFLIGLLATAGLVGVTLLVHRAITGPKPAAAAGADDQSAVAETLASI